MNQTDFDVQWALSHKKQSAYGTTLADGDLLLSYPFMGPDILELTPELQTDEDEMGKGHEFATDQEVEKWDTRLKRSFYMTSFMGGLISVFGLGAVSSAQQESTLAYEHTATPQDPSTDLQLPVTTIVERLSSGIKRKIRDLMVSDFTISGEVGKRIMLEGNFIGSGHQETSALSMPTLSSGSFLRMRGLLFQVGPSGAEVDVSARIKKFSFKWDNAPDEEGGYYPGSGLYRGRCEMGKRKAEFSFTILIDENTTDLDNLLNNTVLKAIVTAQGELIESTYYHQQIITIPRMKYRAMPVGVEGNKLAFNVECNVFFDSVSGWPVEIKTMNTQVSYLT